MVTFLFTDIEGSTRLWETQANAMRLALARHDALVKHAIGAANGQVFKKGGDSFCAVFRRARDALTAALAAQRALYAESWPSEAPIKVRIALHSGVAQLRGRDYFGPPLNRVSRLMAAAHGGQTLLSDAAYDNCKNALPKGVRLKLLGMHTLKDVPEPTTVFQLCHPLLLESFPPLREYAVETTQSIAVLPFVNRSHNEEDEYFSDGLADELLNVLTKIRGLRVAARTSAFQFKGKNDDIAVIGRKLNVATVLEGSVRKAGNRMRISVQLVKVADGYHLWSESYDRTLDDIFAVQDDIAQSVVKELRTSLLGESVDPKVGPDVTAQVAAAVKGRASDPEAHRLYLQARHFIDRSTRDDTAKGVQYLKQALDRDPAFALAWAELGRAYGNEAGSGWTAMGDGSEQARQAVARALVLEPDLAEAHAALGLIHMVYDWDWRGASASYARALELAPGNTLVLRWVGWLAMTLGRFDEAIGLCRRAIEQDPLSAGAYLTLGITLDAADRVAEAEQSYRKVLDLSPEYTGPHAYLALNLVAQGRREEGLAEALREPEEWARLLALPIIHHAAGRQVEADAALRELIAKHAEESAYQVAEVYAARGETDLAFEWLERAYVQRDPGLGATKSQPLFRSLHADQRWGTFLCKMGLAD